MNMTLRQYIDANHVRPADVIVVKKVAGLIDQFLIYLGRISGQDYFMAKFNEGVRLFVGSDFYGRPFSFEPLRIRRFKGNEQERQWVVNRARSRGDVASYQFILSNSEENDNSSIVAGVGLGILLLALGIALFGGGDDKERR